MTCTCNCAVNNHNKVQALLAMPGEPIKPLSNAEFYQKMAAEKQEQEMSATAWMGIAGLLGMVLVVVLSICLLNPRPYYYYRSYYRW